MANDDFSEPPRRADPKNPIFSFSDFWVWVTSEAQGSVSVGFWGSCQLSPFWRGGGCGRRALSTPPPPETKTRPPRGCGGAGVTGIVRCAGSPPPPNSFDERSSPGLLEEHEVSPAKGSAPPHLPRDGRRYITRALSHVCPEQGSGIPPPPQPPTPGTH